MRLVVFISAVCCHPSLCPSLPPSDLTSWLYVFSPSFINEPLSAIDWRTLDQLLPSWFFYYLKSAAAFNSSSCSSSLWKHGAVTRWWHHRLNWRLITVHQQEIILNETYVSWSTTLISSWDINVCPHMEHDVFVVWRFKIHLCPLCSHIHY